MRAIGRLAGVLAIATILAGCPASRGVPPPTAPAMGRLAALLVNGGGQPAINYWSHVNHLREMRRLLLDAGIAPNRLWILASDGEDPGADLSLRTTRVDRNAWLLGGGRYDRALRARVEQTSSDIDGARLDPADRDGLGRWFTEAGRRLAPGDTLLLFVTDHGTKNDEDLADNRITLWGEREEISVRELRTLIHDNLDPGVRVVTIMSQCFSGSFAHLAELDPDIDMQRSTCGYFSTTAERPAYGCYPEARREVHTGHAVRMIRALDELGVLPAAHEATLIWDDTPDVPLRTSDAFLERHLRAAADRAGTPFAVFVDRELQQALLRAGRWEPELRLLDDVAAHYGLFSPRRLAEVETHSDALLALGKRFRSQRGAWRTTRASAADANVERWLATDDEAKQQLTSSELARLDPDGRAALRSAVVAGLAAYTKNDPSSWRRLTRLRDTTVASEAVTYRTEVRLGVLLRMRQLLIRIAGRSHLEHAGSPGARARFDALTTCETLPLRSRVRTRRDVPAPRAALPSFDDDQRLAESFLPSWLGVRFREPPAALAETEALPPGAAFVSAVYPDSPASEAGLEAGDVILGPPDAPFTEPTQIREWTMFHPRDAPATLRFLRESESREATLSLRPFPEAFPKLPGPPPTGAAAPPLTLSAYRGDPPGGLSRGRETLLFFWATWCSFCKSALPEIEALVRERGIDVVAITDEPRRTLDAFFASHGGFFPDTVAVDPARSAFLAYGVSGMPTFVLVSGSGRIAARHVGYSRKRGLPF